MSFKGPYEYPKYYIGLSTDVKPMSANGVRVGDEFFETDTKLTYIYYEDGTWYQKVTAGMTLSMTTVTNPTTSAATTVAIVDAYSGIIILQNDGTPAAQTLGSPTVVTAGKVFTVVNDDASTENVVVNGFTITPGEAQTFIWDGSAWGPTDLGITSIPVPINQGGTGQVTAAAAMNALGVPSATAESNFIVSGTTPFAWIKKTLAEVKTILGLGTSAYTAATDYVTHALATAANDFLVASGSGSFVKKTLAEVLAIIMPSPGPIGTITPAHGRFSPAVSRGPAIINSGFAGTVSTSGSSTTVVFSSAADAILAGYSATAPVLGTTLITAGPFTRYIVSWTNATTCVVDSAVTLTAAAITSVQLPIATFVNSAGVIAGYIRADRVFQVVGVLRADQFSVNGLSSFDRTGNYATIYDANGVKLFYYNVGMGGQILGLFADSSGNILTGGLTAAGTSAAKVWAMGSGTAPTTSPADAAQIWVADKNAVAGRADLHMMNEAGVVKVLGSPSSVAKSSAYTILDTDGYDTIYVSGNTTIKLPVASKMRRISFKKTDGSATIVQIRISDTGSDTVEGNDAVLLQDQYDTVVLESDGTSTWYVF